MTGRFLTTLSLQTTLAGILCACDPGIIIIRKLAKQSEPSNFSKNIDLTRPAPPLAVTATAPAQSSGLTVDYTPSSSVPTLNHNIKACLLADCATACLPPVRSSTLSLTISPLTRGQAYYACVQAVDQAEQISDYVATDGPVVVSGAPISPGFASSFAASPNVDLIFGIPTGENYKEFEGKACLSSDCRTGCTPSTLANRIPLRLEGLADGLSYHGCVRGIDTTDNHSVWIASVTRLTIDLTSPQPPSLVSVPVATSGTFAVNFTPGFESHPSHFEIKFCTSSDCHIACLEGATSLSSPTPINPTVFSNGSDYLACVRAKDMAGNSSLWSASSQRIIYDTTPPSLPTLAINAGAAYSGSRDVTLQLNANGSPHQMYISQTAGCTAGGSWESFNSNRTWTLAHDNAPNTIYVKYRDLASLESACVSASIIHDGVPPSGGSLLISNGAGYTTSANVTLNVTSPTDSSPLLSYVTNSPNCLTGGTWEAFADSKPWTLAQTNTTASVYVQFKDAAGHTTACFQSSIIHDSINPAAALSPTWTQSSPSSQNPSTASWTRSSSSDVVLQKVQFYQDGTCSLTLGSAIDKTSSTETASLTASDGTYAYKIQSIDAAGNAVDSTCSTAMTIDTLAPTAVLSGTPSGTLRGIDLDITISGDGVSSYRYAIVSGANACSLGSYSAETPTASKITNSTAGYGDGVLKLCVIGKDAAGNSQATSNATMVSWTKDTTAPTPATNFSLSGGNDTVQASWSASASGDVAGYLLVRRRLSAVGFSPLDGTAYNVGRLDADQDIVFRGNALSFADFSTDTRTLYSYALFSYDARFNYTAPVAATIETSSVAFRYYRFYTDSLGGTDSSESAFVSEINIFLNNAWATKSFTAATGTFSGIPATISSSSQFAETSAAWYVFDNSEEDDNLWQSTAQLFSSVLPFDANNSLAEWIQIDFGSSPQVILGASIKGGHTLHNGAPDSYWFAGSNDQSSWRRIGNSQSTVASHKAGGGSTYYFDIVSPAITVNSNSTTEVNVSWPYINTATGYLLVRRTGNKPSFTPINGTSYSAGVDGSDSIVYVGGNLTYVDSGLTAGTIAYYKIFAYNSRLEYGEPQSGVTRPQCTLSASPDTLVYAPQTVTVTLSCDRALSSASINGVAGQTLVLSSPGVYTITGRFTGTEENAYEITTAPMTVTINTALVGNQTFTSSGTFTVPTGLTTISAVVIGGGGGGAGRDTHTDAGAGGGGGGLRYGTFAVTPGEVLTITVGAGGSGGTTLGVSGGTSSLKRGAATLMQANGGGGGVMRNDRATGGSGGGGGSGIGGVGGGNGGPGGNAIDKHYPGAGGGAAGYAGNGGTGGSNWGSGSSGSGGGGGGGYCTSGAGLENCGGGGGVGLNGQGANGSGNGGAGSGGTAGRMYSGGSYGGGGGGIFDTGAGTSGGQGGSGAVRIIWGPGRSYPSAAQ